jgi:TPR repeat protein
LALAVGEDIEVDEKEAVLWFRRAALQAYPDAEYSLGEMILTGRGAAVDQREAFSWIERAAQHDQALAQTNLAAMYVQGVGIVRDPKKAFYWMSKAAERGVPAAEFGLGSMYAHGDGVPEDVEKGVSWYSRAAEHGDLGAQNNLALVLATSKDAKIRNVSKAVKIARALISSDPTEAVFLDTLATCYFEAGDIPNAIQSEQKAIDLNPEKTEYQDALKRYEQASSRK